ncbi:hypothetical protein Vadar_017705 [Vaccinium darrowii]|nr:hypothetical protein Vadar_017705 [Vaccinium darrowii]
MTEVVLPDVQVTPHTIQVSQQWPPQLGEARNKPSKVQANHHLPPGENWEVGTGLAVEVDGLVVGMAAVVIAVEADTVVEVEWSPLSLFLGFILDDGSDDLFVHQCPIQLEGFRSVGEDESMEFVVEQNPMNFVGVAAEGYGG